MIVLLVIAAMAIAVPRAAEAAGTASGTAIGNSATVNYQVSGVPQTAISTGPSATFVVDNKVNLTVTKLADSTVVPASADQVLSFSVVNNGNTSQSYALSVVSRGTDSFDMNNVRIYRDDNANNAYDAGTDTLYVSATTFGSIAADGTLRVLIVADTPAGQTNGQTAVYDLVATTTDAGTTTETTATTGPNTAGVDVVFADAAGSDAGDVARDGKHSAFGTYTVSAAAVTVTKTSAVYSDPFNITTNPKMIPGAVITYTVTVSNAAGGSNATSVAITDSLNAEIVAGRLAFATQFNDGVNSCDADYGIVVVGDPTPCKTNTNDGDGADWNITAGNTVTVTGLTVNAGSSKTIKFQVIITP
jgi:hypothetical protein